MDYTKVGERIKKIREKELKKTQEEFAEEVGISLNTLYRLETATRKVSNIEFFIRISEITGYSIEELIQDFENSKSKEKIIKKINYLLNVGSIEELEYIFANIRQFLQFSHRNEIEQKSLKEIKDQLKGNKK